MTNLDSILKSRGITLLTNVPHVQSHVFSSSHVQIGELLHKGGWAQKNWCFQVMVPKKTPESPWTARRSNLSCPLGTGHPKGNRSWIVTEGLMLKLNLQYFGHLMWRAVRKDPDAGQDWGQEEKRAAEDEMVRWHHQLHGYEFEQAPGDGEDWEAWHAAVHGVTKSQTWLSNLQQQQ